MAAGVAINGRVLAELRVLRGLTQQTMADACQAHDPHCGVDRDRISGYERERLSPGMVNLLIVRAVLDDVLPLSDGEWRALVRTPTLDTAHNALNDAKEDRTNRKQALSALMAVSLTGALKPRTALDARVLDEHGVVARMFYDAYRSGDYDALISPVSSYADSVLGLLERPVAERDRNRLATLIAGAHSQAGLMRFHAGDWSGAYRRLATAVSVASSSGDRDLHAQTLGASSYLYSSVMRGGRGGDPVRAVGLMTDALALAADPFTRGWIGVRLADEMAARSDAAGCAQALETAETALSVPSSGPDGFFNRHSFGHGVPGHLESVQALALAMNGMRQEAEQQLGAVLDGADTARRRVNTLTHTGIVRAVCEEPEGACEALAEAFTLALSCGQAMGVTRVRGARSRFDERWTPLSCVAELDERLALRC